MFVPVDFGLETQLTDRRGKRRRKRSSFLSGFSMATVLTVRAATFQLLLYHLAVRGIWGMRGNRGAGRLDEVRRKQHIITQYSVPPLRG